MVTEVPAAREALADTVVREAPADTVGLVVCLPVLLWVVCGGAVLL